MKKYVCIVLFLSLFFVCACQKEEVLLAETITGSYRETIIPIPENYCVYEALVYIDGVFTADLFYTDNGGKSYDLVLNKKTISFDKYGENVTVAPYQGSEIYIYRWEKDDALFVSDEYFSVTYTSDGNQICTLDIPKILDYDI